VCTSVCIQISSVCICYNWVKESVSALHITLPNKDQRRFRVRAKISPANYLRSSYKSENMVWDLSPLYIYFSSGSPSVFGFGVGTNESYPHGIFKYTPPFLMNCRLYIFFCIGTSKNKFETFETET
jgi:hypothetical protein